MRSPARRWGVRGYHPPENVYEIFDAKSRVWGQFGPENKLIEGQPNEYDVICWNASVLAFHMWPTIFAGAPFRLQNICRNGVPPRSRTTAPLFTVTYRRTYTIPQHIHCTLRWFGVARWKCDDADVCTELKCLFTRTNIVITRFSRCSSEVKIRLFRSFCMCFMILHCGVMWKWLF